MRVLGGGVWIFKIISKEVTVNIFLYCYTIIK